MSGFRSLGISIRQPLRTLVRGGMLGLMASMPCHASLGAGGQTPTAARDLANIVINETKPLTFPRGKRLPVVVWALQGIQTQSNAVLEDLLRKLDQRGIAAVANWNYGDKEKSLADALKMAAAQKKLGIEVVVISTGVMGQFFNGNERTAHVDDAGRPFFDLSFLKNVKIGCPFAVDFRYPAIRKQVEYFVRAYKDRDLPLDLVIGDWEVDGPIEWNDAWNNCRMCARCRENIRNIDDFTEFQATLRRIRCDMQKRAFVDVVKQYFPNALVGNYGVSPNDGYRYWYDYYEREVDIQPYKTDQRARYRPWFQEFPLTGYTCAMPVVYTWYRTFDWYDFENVDYRWFYNMLLEASGVGRSTPADIPIITFVHWHTTASPRNPDPNVRQFGEEKYQELLWHLFLRGHDALAIWSRQSEIGKESRLVQQIYAAALEYKEFLDRGTPVNFDVPPRPAPVVSGLVLGDRVLVRRTDFDAITAPVLLKIGARTLWIPRVDGRCQILKLAD